MVEIIVIFEDALKPFSELKPGQLNAIKLILKEVQIENIMVWNHEERKRMSPLHIAAATGNFEMAKLLVEEFKADLSFKDDGGNTPLYWAVLRNHTNIVKVKITLEQVYLWDHQCCHCSALKWP